MFKQMSPSQQRMILGSLGSIFVLVVILLTHVPVFKPLFTATISAIVGISMWELYQIARAKGLEPIEKLGITFGVLYAIAAGLSTQYAVAKILPEITLLIALIACFLYFFTNGTAPFVNLSVTLFGFTYLAIPLSCFIFIAYFFPDHATEDSRWWLFYLVTVTKMADTGGYFIGKKFGTQKLAPYISPKKTWEGAIGGLIIAIAASVIITLLAALIDHGSFSLTLWQSLWLGAIIGILAQCGDLAESLLKRDGGIKDSNQLPGLGGMLDIADSLVFTTPLVYIFLKAYAE